MIFSYGLAFVVLWEWLRPLPVITDTANLNVFVWFTLFCFVIMYLRLASYIAVPLIFIAMMYSLHEVFFEGSFLREGFHMLVWFGEDLVRNVSYLKDREIISLSFEFRSFLVFVVLATISYLIHFWLCHVKKIFFFLLITFIYITVIDTFTVYDASSAIIRLVVAGFLLTTILFKMRLEATEEIVSNQHRGLVWLNLAVIIIMVVAVSAFYAPKFEPQWPNPVSMVQGSISGEQNGVNTGRQTIGYSQNDERLGGGFTDDNSTVFTAITKEAHYWRGESKEVYTGKGWESVRHELNRTFRYSDEYEASVAISTFNRDVPTETVETKISMVDGHRFWHFFYAGELLGIDELEFYNGEAGEQPFRYLIDYVSGKVGTTIAGSGSPIFLKEYTITHKTPKFVIDVLKKTPQSDPEHIQEIYLQLPKLPDRVGVLASEITAEYDNRYEKVKAVEGYFTKNHFRYESKEVAIPEADQDYVDQFLFETQQGYCDNYSTAMIVMLRTLDIPARWVKGFTQGERVEDLEDGYKKYEISNHNAHSWVEVYFNDVGWVPFEPTKGFTNMAEFVDELPESENELNEMDEETVEETTPEIEEVPLLPLDEELESDSGEGSSKKEGRLRLLQFSLVGMVTLIGMVLAISSLIWKRKKVITLFFLYLYKLKANGGIFYVKAYHRLLWLLDFNGHKRLNGETLREYALRIDELFDGSQMMELTLIYEKLYYGNRSERHLWEEKKGQWVWLVGKISS